MNKKSFISSVVVLGAFAASSNATLVFSENFNGGGTGVFAVTATDGVVWDAMTAIAYDNFTGAAVSTTDNAMTASSDFFGTSPNGFDTKATASVNAVGFNNLTLDYDLNFQNFAGGSDRLEVYAGANLIFTHSADTGGFFDAPGVHFTHNISVADNSTFGLRFRYVDESANAFEWYAQVDNVTVNGRDMVPEPATFAVLGLGALALIRRRRNKI